MRIKILKDFTYTPGPRYIHEGPHSGEEFRRNILLDAMKLAIEANKTLTVDLDGTAGYGRSFLEESFGGMIRVDSVPFDEIISHLEIISEEEPEWKTKIEGYLRKADAERKLDPEK